VAIIGGTTRQTFAVDKKTLSLQRSDQSGAANEATNYLHPNSKRYSTIYRGDVRYMPLENMHALPVASCLVLDFELFLVAFTLKFTRCIGLSPHIVG
jgi:hypothetical protein